MLFLAVVGTTFAYFYNSVFGNEEASNIEITTAVMGDVVFSDGEEIDGSNIYPGWYATKTFTIANTTSGANS